MAPGAQGRRLAGWPMEPAVVVRAQTVKASPSATSVTGPA